MLSISDALRHLLKILFRRVPEAEICASQLFTGDFLYIFYNVDKP